MRERGRRKPYRYAAAGWIMGTLLHAACIGLPARADAQAVDVSALPAGQSEPSWSPDGSRIAFRGGSFPDVDIWVANADGAQPRRLTRHPAPDDYPAFSPDGRQLAFVSRRDGVWKLYVMDVDGSNLRELMTTSTAEQDPARPAWMPEGGEILIRIRSADEGTAIVAIAPDGGARRTIPTPAGADWPSASPDGGGIVFTAPDDAGVSQVWSADHQGGSLRKVTSGPLRKSLPRVEPDGRHVVHVTNETGGPLGWEVYRTRLDDGSSAKLTDDDHWKFYPEPAPDGQSILFATIRGGMSDPVRLWRMDRDGSNARPAFSKPN